MQERTRDLRQLRVAIVHPFLISNGGGEKVVEALVATFPRAELFTLMADRSTLSPLLLERPIHTTVLDRGPRAWRYYQHLSPLYDFATARHDVSGFDLVISSGGPGAKTVTVPGGIPHIHYCHSPVRYLWDQHETWLERLPLAIRPAFALSVRGQRKRDLAAVNRVDSFVANSRYIAARIRRYYGRDSAVVYPPVSLSSAPVMERAGDYYLTVGRLVPGKRTELLIAACNRLRRRLIVAGGGAELAALQALAGETVEVLGRVSETRLQELYAGARAFLFAADEDFGIATVEAQSYGLPAIAYGHGGSLEILSDGAEGTTPDAVFFAEQSSAAVEGAIVQFEAEEDRFDRCEIQRRAARFSAERFREGMAGVVLEALR
ncbi:glycosyltransferase [Novosphingobium sp. RD2P27]|uniref:Glycosyltransferase n=1 Tax=Novosphingobium kalidii TaxID=3230299 RepID=A0ABV2D1N1_9SPHN